MPRLPRFTLPAPRRQFAPGLTARSIKAPLPTPRSERPIGLTLLLAALLSLVLRTDAAGSDGARPLFIEGYAGRLSYAPGQTAELHISTSGARFSIDIRRIGATNELVWSKRDLPGREHPVPEDASSRGCRWPVATGVAIPDTWRSGYYVATLRTEDSGGAWTQRGRRTAESDLYFVVRSGRPGRDTRILLQLAANTYNAYNNWGGFSLYAYNGRAGNQGSRVSFHRPGGSQFFNWEHPFIAWAERNGYAIDYAVNYDLEHLPGLLDPYRLVLSVGHDEYWSGPMRDAVEAHLARGGHAAFLSGNSVCWQVRSEDQGHALVCWKQNYFQDPVFKSGRLATLSTLWSHHLVGRPENQLTGVGFLWGGYRKSHGQFMEDPAEFTVHRPDHWLLAGTGLRAGDRFGGPDTVVGYECDGCELTWRDGLPHPTGRDGTPAQLTVLATCPVRWHPDDAEWYERWEKGRTGHAVLGLHTRPGGGTVVTAGTTDWSHGLRGRDPHVERITRNLLDRLGRAP